MEVTIFTSSFVNSVTVSASTPGVAHVQPIVPMVIELQLFRDGQDGKDSYEIAVSEGYTGTREDFVADQVTADINFNAYYILSKN
jgi:hypothetical protein